MKIFHVAKLIWIINHILTFFMMVLLRITCRCVENADKLPFEKYKYAPQSSFPLGEIDSLRPSYGDNLMALLLTRRDLKEPVANLVRSFGLRLF